MFVVLLLVVVEEQYNKKGFNGQTVGK